MREDWSQLATAWAKQHTPSATTIVLGKHLMFWERPAEFDAALDQFLASIK